MNRVLSIMSLPKRNFSGMSCSVVWYMLRPAKSIAANISDQDLSSSRLLFCKSYICMRFAMTWLNLSNAQFASGFAVGSNLALSPYIF